MAAYSYRKYLALNLKPQPPMNLEDFIDIAAGLKLNDSQRAGLEVVQDTTMGAMEALSPCPPKDVLTPPARLKAAKARLEAMREAIRTVNDAVDDFEVDLSDEQKTLFEGLGPRKRGV